MYVRNSSKKRKYLIVKLFGTRSCDGSLYVCCCRYNGCINSRDVHIKTPLAPELNLPTAAKAPARTTVPSGNHSATCVVKPVGVGASTLAEFDALKVTN